MNYNTISPYEMKDNLFATIGNEWMLIGAYDKESTAEIKYNAMTASWGCTGVLWGKPVFWCYVRPQRYTKEFTEKSDTITLSFLGREQKIREAYNICGRKSGRDGDKLSEAGLHPFVTEQGELMFEESHLTIVGKKLYVQRLDPECFTACGKELDGKMYPAHDYHLAYCCEILKVITAE